MRTAAIDALRALAAARAVGTLRTIGAAAAAAVAALEVGPGAIAAIVGSRAAAPVVGIARRARFRAQDALRPEVERSGENLCALHDAAAPFGPSRDAHQPVTRELR